MLLDQFQEQFIHRKIALLGNPAENGPVGKVIVIMRILADIEEAVKTEAGRLVHLEIQANIFLGHNTLFYN